jgi:hypothetical protein
MFILLGPQGGLGWDNTQTFYRANWDVIRRRAGWEVTGKSAFDSNTPPWQTFRCPGCRRILPTDIAHVDHKTPRANLQYKVTDPSHPGNSFGQSGHVYTIPSKGSMDVVMTNFGVVVSAIYKVVIPTPAPVPALLFRRDAPPPAKRSAHPPPPIRDQDLTMKIYFQTREVEKKIIDVLENDMSNLQLLCSYCNVAKGNRDHWAWGAPSPGARV